MNGDGGTFEEFVLIYFWRFFFRVFSYFVSFMLIFFSNPVASSDTKQYLGLSLKVTSLLPRRANHQLLWSGKVVGEEG